MGRDAVLERYSKHMPRSDDLTLIILKGQLLVEEMLARIVRTIVAHGELLEETRFSFANLLALARSMCWSKHDSDMWDLVSSINALRNDLAHNLESPRFQTRLTRVLQAQLASIEDPEVRDNLKAQPIADQLRHAIVYSMGFLDRYYRDACGYRKAVDDMYRAMSKPPKQKSRKTPAEA